MEILINFFKGIIIGIAHIIPGVSGGTIAVVFNIYDKLLGSINNFFKDIKKNVLFLGPIGIGVCLGTLLFSKVLAFLLDAKNGYMEATHFLFIGLIIGSLPTIYKKATEEKVKKINYLFFAIAFLIVFGMTFIGSVESTENVIREINLINIIILIITGFIAAATMIIPGVSGSFVLLMLGLYSTVITAVSELNIPILIPVMIGVGIGILTLSRGIEHIFKKYPQTAYFTVLGLVVASTIPIYPGFSFDFKGILSIISGICGFALAVFMERNEAK